MSKKSDTRLILEALKILLSSQQHLYKDTPYARPGLGSQPYRIDLQNVEKEIVERLEEYENEKTINNS